MKNKERNYQKRTNWRTNKCNSELSFESHISPMQTRKGTTVNTEGVQSWINMNPCTKFDGGLPISMMEDITLVGLVLGVQFGTQISPGSGSVKVSQGQSKIRKIMELVSVWKVRTHIVLSSQYQQNNVGLFQTFSCTGLSYFGCIFVWWSRSNTSIMFSRLFNKS